MAKQAQAILTEAGIQFEVIGIKQARKNPLYDATEICERDLLSLQAPMTNKLQVKEYLVNKQPFVRFFVKP
jgi:hypothetical protein